MSLMHECLFVYTFYFRISYQTEFVHRACITGFFKDNFNLFTIKQYTPHVKSEWCVQI